MAEGQQETQVVAKYDYRAENAQELTMRKGDRLLLVDDTKDWWKVRCPDSGKEGFVPSNFVKIPKPKASLFSTILKKRDGKKNKSTTSSSAMSSESGTKNWSTNCPSPSMNGGDPSSLRVGARTNGSSGSGGGTTTETFQLGQCVPACAKYLYTAQRGDEISLVKGERLMVIEKSSDGWWRGRKDDGSVGWFPSNYVEEVGASSSGGGGGSSNNSNSNNATMPGGGGIGNNGNHHHHHQQHHPHHQHHQDSGNLLYFTAAEAKSQSSPSHSSSDNNAAVAVLALYQFTGKNSGELSCQKGERLDVVVWEPDSDWMSVRNSRGETGVVPTNYVTPTTTPHNQTGTANAASSGEEGGSERATSTSTSSSNPQSQSQSISSISNNSIAALALAGGRKQFQVSGPLADKDWYYGKISRNQCEDLLTKFAQDGDFLIRDSESTTGHFTVSLKAPGRNKHFRVKNTSGTLEIGLQKFSNWDSLIEHYKKHPIFKQENEKLYLVKPFTCPTPQDN